MAPPNRVDNRNRLQVHFLITRRDTRREEFFTKVGRCNVFVSDRIDLRVVSVVIMAL